MLVLKKRHGFGLALIGVGFVLQLSSCDSGNGNGNGNTAGAAGSAAGALVGTAGKANAGSSGMSTGAGAGGSGGGLAMAGAGGALAAAGALSSGGSGGVSDSGGTAGMAGACTDVQNPDHAGEPCSIWPDYDATKGAGMAKDCDASWLTGAGYCLESCGKCKSSTGSGGGSSTGGNGSGGGFSTGLGPGPALPDVTSGTVHWASRYWDCCKPHCSTNGNIPSCGSDGVSKNSGTSACSGGSAYTCYNQAPRAIGDNVSYGYVAVPNPSCGSCYHLQFTGQGQFSATDPGSKALAGKHMIVKISNTGGDVASNQFDLMIPGGGVGQNANTCTGEWKLSSSDLGPTQGGFLTGCTGTYAAKRDCVRQKCMLLPDGDLRKGCIWFVDWYAAADNPTFHYESIQCPSDI